MRVVVAMSGGVDSAVAAARAKEEGHEVVGVHLKLHDRDGRCCSLDDALDARRTAALLDIPFYVFDLRDSFRTAVMEDFVDEWVSGRTPTPCVRCNGVVKFRVLLARALELGADRLATGHYARILDGAVAMATHTAKDQSYFLFPLRPAAIERTWFPLGDLTKEQVRAHAAALGLPVADKPESQEVCFLPDDDHTSFVRAARPDLPAAGDIVTEDGAVVGQHDAWYRFTIGQRRGLNVALGRPAFVLRVEPDSRRVVVTTEPHRLGSMGLVAGGAVFVDAPEADRPVQVRVRHRGELAPARVRTSSDGRFEVAFEEPVRAVAPGQAAVVYDGPRVLGGGFVDLALPVAPFAAAA
ncbi:MAG: tRNA 2-thiouridine(34) synthase MnmA [Alphaproteobacteria bacterium]|nr:tRNA 2-thiouridine(34) synthase MnmA [Alphaproteobacteria bacterium]MCB9698309.1 tRNA 2-thiouridine(34) synthase MnmA [Alphaproteobacteria bacterium]